MFDKYGIVNCEIELIELVNCNSKDELHAREQYWIKSSNCVNKILVGRSQKEYYQDNREQLKEYQRKYDEANCDKKKEYYLANRDKIRDCQRKYREHHKKKEEDHLEDVTEEDFFEAFREDENDLGESVL